MDPCSNLPCRSSPAQDGVFGPMRIRHTCHKVVEEVGFPFGSLVHLPKTSGVLQYTQHVEQQAKNPHLHSLTLRCPTACHRPAQYHLCPTPRLVYSSQ